MSIRIDMLLNTAGDGLWSDKKAKVLVTEAKLRRIFDDESYGELRVYFDTNHWRIDDDGLIYTDSLFESELKYILQRKGIDTSKLGYSEQGMQGDDYVSFDINGISYEMFKEKEDA